MRFLVMNALALLLLVTESVISRSLGVALAGIDLSLVIIVFLALRAPVVSGAFTAFTIGYLLDVMTGHPTGLYPFLGVLTFLMARVLSSLVDVRGPGAFALFVASAQLGHGVLVVFLVWLTSKEGAFPRATASSLPLQVLVAGVGAALLWRVLKRLDPGVERPEVGVLR